MSRRELEAWLAARRPERPAALAARMSQAVAETPESAVEGERSLARALGIVGVRLLRAAAGREPQAPGLAMDILAADAFVTYAFEAAAEQGEAVETLAGDLIKEAAA